MTARKPVEATMEVANDIAETAAKLAAATGGAFGEDGDQPTPKLKVIRNRYHSPLQISDGVIIPVGGSVDIDDIDALTKNQTVAAWLKAGVLEVI